MSARALVSGWEKAQRHLSDIEFNGNSASFKSSSLANPACVGSLRTLCIMASLRRGAASFSRVPAQWLARSLQ